MQCLPAESDLLCLIVWSLVGVDEPDQAGLRPVLLRVPLWVLVQKLLQITTQLQAGGCCVWPVRVPGRQVAGLSFRWLCRCRQQGTAFDPVLSTNRDAEDKRGLAKLLRSGGSRDLSDPQLQAATQKVLAEPGRQKSQQLPFLHLLAPHVHAAGQRALPNVCARKAGQALQLASAQFAAPHVHAAGLCLTAVSAPRKSNLHLAGEVKACSERQWLLPCSCMLHGQWGLPVLSREGLRLAWASPNRAGLPT